MWRVVDLFSGGGGMSYGFHAHPEFEVVAAADAQVGKPSSRRGSLACNDTYELNMGVRPQQLDLSVAEPADLDVVGPVDVLTACPPCTGFSRTNAQNHVVDDARNGLVGRVARFVAELQPQVLIMENARELLQGNFRHHYEALRGDLEALGYEVRAETHLLTRFGLPQIRERAVIIAARTPPPSLDDLWHGHSVDTGALTVRRAIGSLATVAVSDDPAHVAPAFGSPATAARMAAIPHDGGSWRDLHRNPALEQHLTPAMRDLIRRGRLGSHPDVYGRVRWDAPSPTIKRECGHVGNGRYAHPEQNRLLTLREIALLNGFPAHYRFGGNSLVNRYRHVGDAVPPLISYQLAALASWTMTGVRPSVESMVLPGTTLRTSDVRSVVAA